MASMEIANLSPEEQLKKFKISRLIGYSMYPTLRENDTLFLENVTPADIKVGDLVIFKGQNKSICHRIVSKKIRNGLLEFREKGDNCAKANPLMPDQIIARVKEVYRGRSHWYASNPKLARFNVFMTLVFRFLYFFSMIRKACLPKTRFPRLSRAITRLLRTINQLGNRRLGE